MTRANPSTADTTSPERLLSILEMFERETRPMSLKEISETCRIPTSTCHSLVQTLLRRSYLYQTGRRKDFYPTGKLRAMGATISAHDKILQRLSSLMDELRDITRETAILGKRQRDEVLYLEVLEGPQTIRYSARVGETKPLHSTCIGKAMLSRMASAELLAWTNERPLASATPNTITQAETLIRDLEEGRKRGYFVTRGENVVDVAAIAIPLEIDNELFGVAVAGPAHRIEAQLSDIVGALQQMSAALDQQGVTNAGKTTLPQPEVL